MAKAGGAALKRTNAVNCIHIVEKRNLLLVYTIVNNAALCSEEKSLILIIG